VIVRRPAVEIGESNGLERGVGEPQGTGRGFTRRRADAKDQRSREC
jgi:hypothetical protein